MHIHIRVFFVVADQELVVDENTLKQIHFARGLVHHDLRQLFFVARVGLDIAQVLEHHTIAVQVVNEGTLKLMYLPLVAAQFFNWGVQFFTREPRHWLTVMRVSHFTIPFRESDAVA